MQELEHNENCPECPYTDLYPNCFEYLGKHALALINLQEQRIGELEKRLRYLLQSKTIAEYDEVDIHTKEYVKDIHSLDANIKELAEENEGMTATIKILVNNNADLEFELAQTYDLLEESKADTVREMQERIKQYIDVGHYRSPTEICFSELDVANIIDRIAKEMLGDAE